MTKALRRLLANLTLATIASVSYLMRATPRTFLVFVASVGLLGILVRIDLHEWREARRERRAA